MSYNSPISEWFKKPIKMVMTGGWFIVLPTSNINDSHRAHFPIGPVSAVHLAPPVEGRFQVMIFRHENGQIALGLGKNAGFTTRKKQNVDF